MRRTFVAIIVIAGGVCAAPVSSRAAEACDRACSDALRINEIQTVGTAESYKQRPSDDMLSLIRMGGNDDAAALDFQLPPVPDQLDAGARSLEFDIAYDPHGGLFKSPSGASMAGELLDEDYIAAMSTPGFKVIHVLDVDFKSSCLTLKACLDQVAAWSHAHSGHLPIVILLHANDARTPMPGATTPVPFDAAAMDALDTDIRSVFADTDLITPDMVQGSAPSLREAVLARQWPTLAAARGKVMFVLDEHAPKIKLYQGARRNLEGRVMFVTADETSPLAAFVCIDDPRKEAARIAADVKAGFMVRTRADEDAVEARAGNEMRRAAAFASGAQIVSTDFLMPDAKIGAYKVNLSDNPRATDKEGEFVALPATGPVLAATLNRPAETSVPAPPPSQDPATH